MSFEKVFEIRKFDFTPKLFDEFQNIHEAKGLWPLVYILSDGKEKEAYVGETTDVFARMSSHLKTDAKKLLTAVHLITSNKFNKSATLDIESNLIKYISGDGQFKLMNGNIGLANHEYYQKKEYWNMFESIWNKLRSEGISKHSIEYINNSDLFKYSPYKSLTNEQRSGLMVILKGLLSRDYSSLIIEGGAGTGKTILAIFLFKLLQSNNEDFNFKEFGEDEMEFIQLVAALKKKYPSPSMALVVPMSSFRKTLQNVFKNIKGLTSAMVVGPTEISKNKYDIIVVDESHRLRRRVNLGTYFKAFDDACERLGFDKNTDSELDWVIKQSGKAILFYDENQSIKPSDVKKEKFDKLKSVTSTKVDSLKSQFRVKGGNGYVNYIDKLLKCSFDSASNVFNSKVYEFVLFDSIHDFASEIKLRNKEVGLSRMVAGYSWEWVSNKNVNAFDITIDGLKLQWNRTNIDWVNSVGSENEVGCIHTTQGYDLNYTGVIFGNEISYDKVKNEIVILKENYFDKMGKQSVSDPDELKEFIVNIYKTILLRGIKGTYVYVCDKNLKEYFSRQIEIYKYKKEIQLLSSMDVIPFENSIPVYNLTAAAGRFSDMQVVDENDFDWIALPSSLKPSRDLFACYVMGESMNKVIPSGSLCVFRKYSGGSRNGKIVLVELTDFRDSDTGASYTVKEYHSKKIVNQEGWEHQSITLIPLSENVEYKDIELSREQSEGLKVVGIFECVC